MKNTLKLLTPLICIVGIFFLSGCGSAQPQPSERLLSLQEQKIREIQRERSLQHFIEGTALDAKGSLAEAILEYQESLQSDPNASIYYAISKDYLLLNKFNRAIESAGEAVRLEPNNISYRENLGTIYFNASRPDLAIQEYQKIIQIDSNYTSAWIALAHLYQPLQPLKSLEIYEKILDRTGDPLDILFQCAQLYSALGRYDEAAVKYKRMLELDPSNVPLQKQLAETYAKGGRLDQARGILEKMVETDSSDADVAATLADVYLDLKQYSQAKNLYETLFNRDMKNTEIRLRIGIGFFSLSEHDSTLVNRTRNIFEDLHKELPADWRPCWYLGAIAANQHNDSLAGAFFEQVTQLEEHHADAWWFYGSSLFEQGKYSAILDAMDHAQRIIPNDFRFYLLRGLALIRLDRQEEAVAPLEQAHKLNPKDMNSLSTLAMTLDGLHRYTESDKLYEEGLRLEPTSALLLNNYGYSLAERGLMLQRALEMSRQAVAAESDNSAYLDTYGWVFYRLEKFQDAAEYIEKSIATGKASAVVYEHLGDVYLKLGKQDKALVQWKKAQEMDPKNESVKEKILRGVH